MSSCTVVSSQKKVWHNKDTGEIREYYRIFVLDSQGGVGYISSNKPVEPGKKIKFDAVAGNDGRLRLIIAE
jgi:hypothetical protein